MKALTLKHLRYFEALARHRHFGRAADAVAISQPALSMQIKELEALMGGSLVERGARHIRLTPLGESLAERARGILREIAALEDLRRTAEGPLSGRFRLGVIPTVAPYLLPQLVQTLRSTHPDLALYPREAITAQLLAELTEGTLDAAIVALPIADETLTEAPLLDEEFLLVRPESAAGQPAPAAAELRAMRLLLLDEGHCFRDQALAFCAAGSDQPRDIISGSSLATLVQMVGAGIGVTLIPEMAAPVETRAAPVSTARLLTPRPRRQIGMAWRRASPLAAQIAPLAADLHNSLTPPKVTLR